MPMQAKSQEAVLSLNAQKAYDVASLISPGKTETGKRDKRIGKAKSVHQQHKNNCTMALLSAAIRRAMAPRATASVRSMSTKTRADLLAGSG